MALNKIVLGALLMAARMASAQTPDNQMANLIAGKTPFFGYVFVSNQMSDSALTELARDSARTGMTLVLNGYTKGSLEETKKRVLQINNDCCGRNGAHWKIDPPAFDKFKVKAVPTFLVSVGESGEQGTFTKVSGEMSVANALKFIYQGTKNPQIAAETARVYKRLSD